MSAARAAVGAVTHRGPAWGGASRAVAAHVGGGGSRTPYALSIALRRSVQSGARPPRKHNVSLCLARGRRGACQPSLALPNSHPRELPSPVTRRADRITLRYADPLTRATRRTAERPAPCCAIRSVVLSDAASALLGMRPNEEVDPRLALPRDARAARSGASAVWISFSFRTDTCV